MIQKQRLELEKLYWEIVRIERKLAAIIAVEELKWSNLGSGSGVLLEDTPMGRKIDAECLKLEESREALMLALNALKLGMKCLGVSRTELDALRPSK